MEPQHNKYSKGKIYKITDNGYNECYIGSTVQALYDRMSGHRRDYRNYKVTGKLFFTACLLSDKYGIENCKIELIERFECESKEDLLEREGHHIRNTECVNKYIPCRTQKEYKQLDKYKNQQKEYRHQNQDIIRQKLRTYYQENKDMYSDKAKGKCVVRYVVRVLKSVLKRGTKRH